MAQRSNIVESVIAPPPSSYEGYLYSYTNLTTNQIYLGIHKGSVNDDYNHSSTNVEFAEVFADSNSRLKFEVLNYGDYLEKQKQYDPDLWILEIEDPEGKYEFVEPFS